MTIEEHQEILAVLTRIADALEESNRLHMARLFAVPQETINALCERVGLAKPDWTVPEPQIPGREE